MTTEKIFSEIKAAEFLGTCVFILGLVLGAIVFMVYGMEFQYTSAGISVVETHWNGGIFALAIALMSATVYAICQLLALIAKANLNKPAEK